MSAGHDISRQRAPGWLRRRWLALAGMAGALLGQPLFARAMPLGQPTPEDWQRFSAAIEVPVDRLLSLQRLPVPFGVALAGLWVGIVDAAGDPQPWLLGVPHGRAPPAPLRLPLANGITLLAQLDAAGRPQKIELPALPADAHPALLVSPRQVRIPALLLRAAHRLDSGEQRETLLLVQLAPSLGLVWREVATLIRPRGDGFRSFALELVNDPDSDWLALELWQTTLSAADQPSVPAGAPLRLRFGYRDGAYRRLG